jgi:LPS export ABC transporter protein LptC
MSNYQQIVSLVVLSVLGLWGCSEIEKSDDLTEYEGPILELTDVESLYSDSSVVRLKLIARRQLEYENKDHEFPEGIYIEFYDTDGILSSTLKANYCYNYGKEERWRALGNVIVKNVVSNEQLNTEELFWEPNKEIVYTNEFVRIETDGEIVMGEGLEAAQDFSWWNIKNGRGTISLDSEHDQ